MLPVKHRQRLLPLGTSGQSPVVRHSREQRQSRGFVRARAGAQPHPAPHRGGFSSCGEAATLIVSSIPVGRESENKREEPQKSAPGTGSQGEALAGPEPLGAGDSGRPGARSPVAGRGAASGVGLGRAADKPPGRPAWEGGMSPGRR